MDTTLEGRGETASVARGRDREPGILFYNAAPTRVAMRMVKTAFAKLQISN